MKTHDSIGYGIASFILGLISIVFSWVPVLGFVCSILGIVFFAKQRKIKPTGLATAGIVLSIIGLVISVFYNLFWLVLGSVTTVGRVNMFS